MQRSPSFRAIVTDCDLGPFEIEQEELDGLAELEIAQCRTEAQVIEAARGADALLVQYAPITRAVIDSLPSCKVIARYGVGIDMIDLEAASHRGIPVCNVPDYCREEVSDHTCALILALVRKLQTLHRAVQNGRWDVRVGKPIHRLAGRVLGLLGYGGIARLVARKMHGFGMVCIAYDPYVPAEVFAWEGTTPVPLTQLLNRSDVLSVHVALTPQTAHLLGPWELGALKNGAILVNTSRGQVIDEAALFEALRDGRLGGAGLDVLEQEPIGADHPLLSLENVIITPHAAFYSEGSIEELKRQTARAVVRILKGESGSNGDSFGVVNRAEIAHVRVVE
jgi:D-3-phosphoglycerate dehydrogenase